MAVIICLTSCFKRTAKKNWTKQMWMVIIELDNLYRGKRWRRCIENERAWPYPSSHMFRLNVCTSWWLEHLFLTRCSSWLPFNWISSSRSQACHRSQGLLSITTGPTLSGRFRAKLITCLPPWLIAGMFSGATYHAGSLGRVLFVCTSSWNWFCFPASQSYMWKNRVHSQ